MALHHELITRDMRTTSRIVSEKFGKLHKNVLRDIERVIADTPEEFNRLNFEPVTYLDAKGEARPEYLIARDGFMLVVMGFTGKAAMEWKVRFIEAFNAMEAELLRQATATADLDDDDSGPSARAEDLRAYTVRDSLLVVRQVERLFGAAAAQNMYLRLPLPPPQVPPHESAPSPSDAPLAAFVAACCRVTGESADRIKASDLWRAFRVWVHVTGGNTLTEREFHLRMKDFAATWRCPESGRRMGRIKSSASVYTGIVLTVGA